MVSAPIRAGRDAPSGSQIVLAYALAFAVRKLVRVTSGKHNAFSPVTYKSRMESDASNRADAGSAADSPVEIPARGWWEIAKRTYKEIDEDRVLAVAAGVTFFGLLALFPAITAFVSIYGLFADRAEIASHLGELSSFLPSEAVDIISGQIARISGGSESALGLAFLFGLGLALWSANAGMKALFDALNVAYGEKEKRSFVALNAVTLGFTFAGVAFVLLAIGAVAVIPAVLKFFWLGPVTEWLLWAGRWPMLWLALVLALACLYRYAPSRAEPKWRWISPGSVLAATLWIVFSMGFSWYVANFGSYNETYGTLGAMIGFLTWLWLSITIVLMGAELNSETEEQTTRPTKDQSA